MKNKVLISQVTRSITDWIAEWREKSEHIEPVLRTWIFAALEFGLGFKTNFYIFIFIGPDTIFGLKVPERIDFSSLLKLRLSKLALNMFSINVRAVMKH